VYSNQPEVELFVNGKSLGKQTSPEHFFYFMVTNAGESVITAVAGECKDERRIRKVEVFNEEYRLREKGAVLNWFDITEIDGCYSLNDTIEDIMKSKEGQRFFMSMMAEATKSQDGKESMLNFENPENMDGMMKMMGGFTVIRMMKLMSAANVSFTKEQMLEVNKQLNQIKKAD